MTLSVITIYFASSRNWTSCMTDTVAAASSRSARQFPWTAVLLGCLTLLALLFLTPTVGVILSALKSTRDIAFGTLWAIPRTLDLSNFAVALAHPSVKHYFVNTFLVTAPATAGSITLGILAGYVFSKLPFRGSELLFIVIVSGMFFPPQIVLIPLFRLFNRLGLLDTLWPMIIVHVAMGIPICTLPDAQLLRHRAERAARSRHRRRRQRMAAC